MLLGRRGEGCRNGEEMGRMEVWVDDVGCNGAGHLSTMVIFCKWWPGFYS